MTVLLLLSACNSEPLPYSNVSNAELEAKLKKDIPIIDIRLPEEWRETGVIKGSHRITFFNAGG